MSMKHSVYDTDTHFTINPVTRVLTNAGSAKTTIIQNDHNSERVTFEVPRYIEGHDMSLCNVVQVHYNNINAQTRQQNQGVYEVTDLQVDPNDSNVVICSWLISHNATKFAGGLSFLVRFSCVDDQANIDYVWNTIPYSGMSVSNGIYNGEVIAEEYADILEQWYQNLIGTSEEVERRLSDIERQIADLNYKKITATLSVTPSTKEIGDSVTGAKLTWDVSKSTKSIILTLPDDEDTEVDLSQKTSPYIDRNTYIITSKKTWTLTATEADKGASATPTASVLCQHRVYWGLGTDEDGFDEDTIKGGFVDGGTILTTSKSRKISVKPQGKYVYYAVPKDLCDTEPTFQIGEFPATGGFEPKVEITVTNLYKIPIVYYLYRSTELLDVDEPINIYVT